MQINPQNRYIQTANPLSWAGLTRPKVVSARHAAFPQQVVPTRRAAFPQQVVPARRAAFTQKVVPARRAAFPQQVFDCPLWVSFCI